MEPTLNLGLLPPPGGFAPLSGISRAESGVLQTNYFKTHHAFETGHGVRKDEHKVVFSTPYPKAPIVIVSLSGLDASHSTNTRIRVYAQDVTNLGFTAVYETWDNTKIFGVSASWIAIGN
eukprot:TRINITY_DN0_c557_g1_i2.p1 TRINITY_DN0_c557_g1~~TRINITY_DN0_c557_g1_i2.p1  ORF type:complete len:120 (+),score=32.44 TRINITY_DN0_c557_g1_i2:42-401(+)